VCALPPKTSLSYSENWPIEKLLSNVPQVLVLVVASTERSVLDMGRSGEVENSSEMHFGGVFVPPMLNKLALH